MKIEFKKDYAGKKKGDTLDIDGMIATGIINDGYAKVYKETPKKTTSKK